MLSEDTPVRLVRDVEGRALPHIPPGTYGVIVEAYEVPVEGYFVEIPVRDPGTGEYLYDTVVLYPEQFRVLLHPCSVQIDADLDPAELVRLIAQGLGTSAKDRTVETDVGVIQLDGPWPRDTDLETSTGWRSFNYHADVEGRRGASLDAVAHAVSAVLATLWDRGIPAIVECAYDDRLLDGGGFLSAGERCAPASEEHRRRDAHRFWAQFGSVCGPNSAENVGSRPRTLEREEPVLREGTSVRLVCDAEGHALPEIPAGTYGVIVEAYEVPVEGDFAEVPVRDPGTGEYLYDTVVL